MKIEIVSGIGDNVETKECKVPMGDNTKVKINGKDVCSVINYLKFEVYAGEIAYWKIGYVKEKSLWDKFKRMFINK